MGSSKQPTQTTTVQSSEPPGYIQPGLKFAAEEAQKLYAQPINYFPGSTVVPFSPETEQALQLTAQRARAGSPLTQAAQSTLQQVIQGRGVNPLLGPSVSAAVQPLFEQFQQQTIPGLTSSFAAIGRSGSGAENNALQQAVLNFSRGVGEQATRAAFGASEAEAGRQIAATQLAPALAAQDYIDIGKLAGVGGARESLSAAQLQDQIDRYNFAQNIKSEQLNQLLTQLTAAGGGGSTTTKTAPGPIMPSRAASGIGGALSGAAGGALLGSLLVPTLGPVAPLGFALGGGQLGGMAGLGLF